MIDPKEFIDSQIKAIQEQVGENKVVCALSGGVDSSVAASLVDRAIGGQQTCLFINTGLLRKNEFEEVLASYQEFGLNIKPIEAADRFIEKLSGVTDPEQKRKIIGHEFIKIFEEEAHKIPGVKFLVQGTIKADVEESATANGKVVVKSHHNVGGLPKEIGLDLVEPLRSLYKSDVRSVGRELRLPIEITNRQPFPGPGLAIRVLGEVTKSRLDTLAEADLIVRQEISAWDESSVVWQYFAVLLPIKSVGVKAGERVYGETIAVRAIESTDGTAADWVGLSTELLRKISTRITDEVEGINRVVYDITAKPPGTIEWE